MLCLSEYYPAHQANKIPATKNNDNNEAAQKKGKCFEYTPFLDLSQPFIIDGTRQKRDVLQLPPYFIFAKKDKQEYILLLLKQNDCWHRLSVNF